MRNVFCNLRLFCSVPEAGTVSTRILEHRKKDNHDKPHFYL